MSLTRVVNGRRVELSEEAERATLEKWNAAPTDQEWYERIAATRYKHEIAGTAFTHSDGPTYAIATDRQSQALTTGAAVQARRAQEAGNTSWAKQWKTGQGFVTMSADDVLAMGDAVDAHVQAAFDREAELLLKVSDGTITEADLSEGWL